jgi:hypothetical protein
MIFFFIYAWQFFFPNGVGPKFVSSRSCTHCYSKTISTYNSREGYNNKMKLRTTTSTNLFRPFSANKYTVIRESSISRIR